MPKVSPLSRNSTASEARRDTESSQYRTNLGFAAISSASARLPTSIRLTAVVHGEAMHSITRQKFPLPKMPRPAPRTHYSALHFQYPHSSIRLYRLQFRKCSALRADHLLCRDQTTFDPHRARRSEVVVLREGAEGWRGPYQLVIHPPNSAQVRWRSQVVPRQLALLKLS